MGERRMFSKRVVESTRFLKMPATSQNLYFHLGMAADDDGIVEAYPVMCITGASEDDLRILASKNFVTVLNQDMITYINDWLEHNTIRADRKKDSIYQGLLLEIVPDAEIVEARQSRNSRQKEVFCLTTDSQDADNCQTGDGQDADNCPTNDRLSKDKLSKGKLREGKLREGSIEYQQIADMYNNTCVSFPRLTKLSDRRKKTIRARFNAGYTLDDFKRLFEMAEESDFLKGSNNRNWSATFDWLIQDGNMAKVLDGNYQNREPTQKGEKDNGETEGSYSVRLW